MAITLADQALATQRYKNDGYVILKKFFHPQDVTLILDEAKDVFAKQFNVDGTFMDKMIDLFRSNQKTFQNCGKQVQHLVSLHQLSLSQRVMDILTTIGEMKWPVICTRPVMYFNHPDLATKRVYHTVDAHQDWRSMQGSSNAAVLWLPLTDCPKELGALQVLPGSHRHGLRTESIDEGFGMVKLTDQERKELVSLECRQGDAVLFHSMLIHQSGNNITDQPRWSCHFRYNDLEDISFIERGYVHPYIYKPVDELL